MEITIFAKYVLQIYAEAESNTNELARFVLPRRYRICGAAEYRRSREQYKRACSICIAEALQYMRRSVALTCLDWKQDVGQ